MFEVLGAHGVWMQLEAGEVRQPGERSGIAGHHLLGAAARRKADFHHLDPGRPRLRGALLIEELALDTVGIAHQGVGTAAGATQGALGYGEVVLNEVQLGVLGLRKQDLAGVGDRHFATFDHQHFVFVFGLSFR
jgi:hypothetical protein